MHPDLFYMQILFLGSLVLAAHFGGKITRHLRIGEVVGQVLGGVVVGPLLILLLEQRFPAYREALASLHFFTFVFLSIIAFGIGEELSLENLRQVGKEALIMCLVEAFFTWIVITATFFALGFKPMVALIVGSIGIATAPAATFVIMNKLEIGGKMRSVLGGIVVLDDVVEVIVFSIICQAALLLQKGSALTAGGLIVPVSSEFFFAIVVGAGIFLALRLTVEHRLLQPAGERGTGGPALGPEFLSRLVTETPRPSVEALIIVAGFVSLGVGLSLHWHLPFLITAVTAGILIANLYSKEVFQSLRVENATSLYTLVFFALIGANAKLECFHPENLKFVAAYVIARGVGKMGGSYLGCVITKQEKRLSKTLPRLMLPQAGVAAVEAYFVATVMGESGKQILGIILPGLIVFEIVGILSSERALIKWKAMMSGGRGFMDEDAEMRNALTKEGINLADLIRPDCLEAPLRVRSKGEAIWQLVHNLHSAGYITKPGRVLEIILERERQGGTTLGEGISILHGRLPNLREPVVAMGIISNREEVYFNGNRERPVDIVYLVLSPLDNPRLHLQVLAAIARFLSNLEARKELKKAGNPHEAMEVIRRFGGKA